MAALLSTQLDSLRRERDRLEELLMLDANWRQLRVLDARLTAGELADDPAEVLGGPAHRAELVRALSANRIYAARAKLLETIELLSAPISPSGPPAETGSVASRIVLLGKPPVDTFRTRVRVKATAPPLPDPLELIDGLDRRAVELLHAGGVTRFAEIARWTTADTEMWRTRLDGTAHGPVGWWIEQAAALATGHATHFAARARRSEFAALVPPPASEPPRPEPYSPEPVSAPEPARSADVVPLPHAVPCTASPARDSSEVAPATLPPQPNGTFQLTAADLAMKLAEQLPTPPTPTHPFAAAFQNGAVTEDAVGRPSPQQALAELQQSRRSGYARPSPGQSSGQSSGPSPHPTVAAATESDVRVVFRDQITANETDKRPGDAEGRPANGRPRSLLQRLKDMREADRFEAQSYAAYHGDVEEASVTIVRSAEPRTAPSDTPPSPQSGGTPAPASRFLRALTGKR